MNVDKDFLTEMKTSQPESCYNLFIAFADMVFNINLGFNGLVNKDATDSRGKNPLRYFLFDFKSLRLQIFLIAIGR